MAHPPRPDGIRPEAGPAQWDRFDEEYSELVVLSQSHHDLVGSAPEFETLSESRWGLEEQRTETDQARSDVWKRPPDAPTPDFVPPSRPGSSNPSAVAMAVVAALLIAAVPLVLWSTLRELAPVSIIDDDRPVAKTALVVEDRCLVRIEVPVHNPSDQAVLIERGRTSVPNIGPVGSNLPMTLTPGSQATAIMDFTNRNCRPLDEMYTDRVVLHYEGTANQSVGIPG